MYRIGGVVLLVACSSAPPTQVDTDPCVATDTGPSGDCGADGVVTVGTGADAFTPHAVAEAWPLERGSQGLQHVMLSLRVPVDPASLAVPRAALTVGAWRTDDGMAVSTPFTSGWALAPAAGGAEIVGVRVVLPEIDAVVGRTVGFDVRVVPVGSGGVWHGWATGVVAWTDTDTDTPL